MSTLFSLLGVVFGIGSLICFILVIIKMFQHGDKTPAILSLVLILCGIGPLIAFVYGWIKVGRTAFKTSCSAGRAASSAASSAM